MSARQAYPWLTNYLALRPRRRKASDYWLAEIFWLAVLARGVQSLIAAEKIRGNVALERLCRFVQKRMGRLGGLRGFDTGGSTYLRQIKEAQARIGGLALEEGRR